MTKPVLETEGFAAAVIDALASHICVIDQTGVIIAVNRAWRNYAAENPPVSDRSGVGTHYLGVCGRSSGPGSEEAEDFGAGVRSVLDGRTDLFEMEYPCHSPTEKRWYLGRVTPLKVSSGGAVISHLNITDRKLVEFELQKLAQTDPLTGLLNRRCFVDASNQELDAVRRFGIAASLVMIDLDHFKAINDTYGHGAGDEALRRVSHALKKTIRHIDILARLGGEEFVVVLPGTDEAGATLAAERLRLAVGKTPIEHAEYRFTVTASFGVSELLRSDRLIDDGLSRADRALYLAKAAGRNRVERHSAVQNRAFKLSA